MMRLLGRLPASYPEMWILCPRVIQSSGGNNGQVGIAAVWVRGCAYASPDRRSVLGFALLSALV
jgi:hypothetical protein